MGSHAGCDAKCRTQDRTAKGANTDGVLIERIRYKDGCASSTSIHVYRLGMLVAFL